MEIPKFFNPSKMTIRLEAEVADRRVPSFLKQYEDETGVALKAGRHFHVISSANDGKRGLEGRVYFNATPAQVMLLIANGFRVQGPRTRGYLSDQFSYRIDLNSLFWELVKAGSRL